MIGRTVNITISSDKASITIPVIPSQIDFTDGDAASSTASVLGLGEIMYGKGKTLTGVGWSCFFPRSYDNGYCVVSKKKLQKPEKYRKQLEAWKKNQTLLTLTISSIGFSKKAKIKSFTGSYKDFDMDFYYSIAFKLNVTIKTVKVDKNGKVITTKKKKGKKSKASDFKVGSTVTFQGGSIYKTSQAKTAASTQKKKSKCKVKKKASGKHQLYLKSNSKQPKVAGWVDVGKVKK